jgi:hypothetical protein
MMELGEYFRLGDFDTPPIVKPNLITGEGRSRPRPFSAYKVKDQKKKQHRKMAKKSRRQNRR